MRRQPPHPSGFAAHLLPLGEKDRCGPILAAHLQTGTDFDNFALVECQEEFEKKSVGERAIPSQGARR
jgi:hypothetical protein